MSYVTALLSLRRQCHWKAVSKRWTSRSVRISAAGVWQWWRADCAVSLAWIMSAVVNGAAAIILPSQPFTGCVLQSWYQKKTWQVGLACCCLFLFFYFLPGCSPKGLLPWKDSYLLKRHLLSFCRNSVKADMSLQQSKCFSMIKMNWIIRHVVWPHLKA